MLLVLPTNVIQGGKGIPGTHTLAFYENSLITEVKSFITLPPGKIAIKLFTSVIKNAPNELVCLPFQFSVMYANKAKSLP
jgi:hypothetical protein